MIDFYFALGFCLSAIFFVYNDCHEDGLQNLLVLTTAYCPIQISTVRRVVGTIHVIEGEPLQSSERQSDRPAVSAKCR